MLGGTESVSIEGQVVDPHVEVGQRHGDDQKEEKSCGTSAGVGDGQAQPKDDFESTAEQIPKAWRPKVRRNNGLEWFRIGPVHQANSTKGQTEHHGESMEASRDQAACIHRFGLHVLLVVLGAVKTGVWGGGAMSLAKTAYALSVDETLLSAIPYLMIGCGIRLAFLSRTSERHPSQEELRWLATLLVVGGSLVYRMTTA